MPHKIMSCVLSTNFNHIIEEEQKLLFIYKLMIVANTLYFIFMWGSYNYSLKIIIFLINIFVTH